MRFGEWLYDKVQLIVMIDEESGWRSWRSIERDWDAEVESK